jgi:hypothetical protein
LNQIEAAELLNTSGRSIQRAARVLEHGSPELQKAVENGRISNLKAGMNQHPEVNGIPTTSKAARSNHQMVT